MKISILTPDLSHNCLGRAYLLARILQRRYAVEIIGPTFGDGIWEPLARVEKLSYKAIEGCPFPRFVPRIKQMLKEITGDVIYASKPLFTSFGIGLLKKFAARRPLILDIDDWQVGFTKEGYPNLTPAQRFKRLISSAPQPHYVSSYWNSVLSERLVRFADEITVSNSFLKDKFGGTIVWHARDTNAFDPRRFDRDRLRDKFEIAADRKIVTFLGTPRPRKGIEDLIEAVNLMRDNRILLILAGLGGDGYSRKLKTLACEKLGDERVRLFGLQPFKRVPEFLTISDLVVMAQRKTIGAIGQVPARVFDAMAMAKPIIATKVSDLPEILDGCGWIVEPGNPDKLAEAIQYVFDHPSEAEERGWKARAKCEAKYSWDAMEKTLFDIFKKYSKPLNTASLVPTLPCSAGFKPCTSELTRSGE